MNGIWVPGIGSGHDLFDWDAERGHVDDNLIALALAGEPAADERAALTGFLARLGRALA